MIFEDNEFSFKIVLTPNDLNGNYKKLLVEKLKNEYEGKAVENYGLIKSVKRIIRIEDEKIMDPIPNVFFLVRACVSSYIPRQNDIITMIIEKIIPYGIFLQMDFFRVLIPLSNLDENVRIDVQNSAVVVKNKEHYKERNEISIQLQEIRFEKNGYNCLAKVYYQE